MECKIDVERRNCIQYATPREAEAMDIAYETIRRLPCAEQTLYRFWCEVEREYYRIVKD